MKKIVVSAVCLFSSLLVFSQEKKIEYKTFTTKDGKILTDTIYSKQVVKPFLDFGGRHENDTTWTIENQTEHIREYLNTIMCTTQGNFSIGIVNNIGSANNLRIGYFISDNFMIGTGLAVNYSFSNSNFSYANLSLFGRGYLGNNLSSKTFFEGSLDCDFANSITELGLGLGQTFFTSKNFGIDLGLKYLHEFNSNSGNLVLGVGFQGLFSKK